MKLPDKQTMDAWLNMLSDEQRAEVMKTQIAESEKTRRFELAQSGSTRRSLIACDGYHAVRVILAMAFFVGVIILAVPHGCCDKIDNVSSPTTPAASK